MVLLQPRCAERASRQRVICAERALPQHEIAAALAITKEHALRYTELSPAGLEEFWGD
jgi:hypothetical protein